MGEYERSLAMHEESLALRREIGHRRGVASTLDGMAYVQMDRGDLAAAHACFFESVQIRQEVGDRIGLMNALWLAADLEAVEGRWPAAVRFCGAADRAQKDLEWEDHHAEITLARIHKTREVLGEDVFEAEWSAGETLSLDEAIEECLRLRPIP